MTEMTYYRNDMRKSSPSVLWFRSEFTLAAQSTLILQRLNTPETILCSLPCRGTFHSVGGVDTKLFKDCGLFKSLHAFTDITT
jgi:hypothetical protein